MCLQQISKNPGNVELKIPVLEYVAEKGLMMTDPRQWPLGTWWKWTDLELGNFSF